MKILNNKEEKIKKIFVLLYILKVTEDRRRIQLQIRSVIRIHGPDPTETLGIQNTDSGGQCSSVG
jgi:hypothetical protein